MKTTPSKPEIVKSEAEMQKLKKAAHTMYVDAYSFQLKELFFIKNKKYIGEPKDVVCQTDDFKKFCKKNENNYIYVYYPWNHTLVKTVKKKDYLELKTNRNRDLITAEEQEILRNARIGVFGMSVGSNVAFVLTQAGISNEITIADFDELDTTNLNRILAGVHQIGVPKVDVAARRIYEDNPFAKVNVMPNGIDKEKLEKLLKNKKLDLLVDEVDDILFKIQLRMLAQKYKLPVVMVTDNGDGVVLHIERYDLAHKKIFGKEKKYFESLIKAGLSKPKIAEMIVSDIVGGIDKVDKRMHQSIPKVIQKELVSWPQLGSAALLAGVVATFAIKQIILGYDKKIDVRGHISTLEATYGKH